LSIKALTRLATQQVYLFTIWFTAKDKLCIDAMPDLLHNIRGEYSRDNCLVVPGANGRGCDQGKVLCAWVPQLGRFATDQPSSPHAPRLSTIHIRSSGHITSKADSAIDAALGKVSRVAGWAKSRGSRHTTVLTHQPINLRQPVHRLAVRSCPVLAGPTWHLVLTPKISSRQVVVLAAVNLPGR
jgi:hypothetical protein